MHKLIDYSKATLILLCHLILTTALFSQASLVRDIAIGPSKTGRPKNMTVVGNSLFFVADSSSWAAENFALWKTDGTPEGTELVKAVYEGTDNTMIKELTDVGGVCYFSAIDGVWDDPTGHGRELWKSDGTSGGTVLVKDLKSNTSSGDPQHLTEYQGNLLFIADSDTEYGRLWRSDGTAEGTYIIIDRGFGGIRKIEGNVFPYSGSTIWRTDGTSSGTAIISKFNSEEPNSAYPDWGMVQIGNYLVFSGNNSQVGTELFRVSLDTSNRQIELIKDIYPGESEFGSIYHGGPSNFLKLNESVFLFTATTADYCDALWRSDGTASGTVFVAPLSDRCVTGSTADHFRKMKGKIYFIVDTELWVSDGSAAGTFSITASIPDLSISIQNVNLTVVGDTTLLFGASYPGFGIELWRSNGTTSTTVQVADINPGSASSRPGLSNYRDILSYYDPFPILNGHVFFEANDGEHQYELWKYNVADPGWALAIENEQESTNTKIPHTYSLHQNFPNPFNPVSTIRYDLPRGSEVLLIVYDILGREVVRLVDSNMEPGYHQTQWDGRDQSDRSVPSGIYIARLVTPVYAQSIKMLLLK